MHIFKRKRKIKKLKRRRGGNRHEWTRVGTPLIFRAEIMPGCGQAERTYTVAKVLASGRVELVGLTGEHTKTEFESAA